MCKFDIFSVCMDEFTDKTEIMNDCDNCPFNPKNEKKEVDE